MVGFAAGIVAAELAVLVADDELIAATVAAVNAEADACADAELAAAVVEAVEAVVKGLATNGVGWGAHTVLCPEWPITNIIPVVAGSTADFVCDCWLAVALPAIIEIRVKNNSFFILKTSL